MNWCYACRDFQGEEPCSHPESPNKDVVYKSELAAMPCWKKMRKPGQLALRRRV